MCRAVTAVVALLACLPCSCVFHDNALDALGVQTQPNKPPGGMPPTEEWKRSEIDRLERTAYAIRQEPLLGGRARAVLLRQVGSSMNQVDPERLYRKQLPPVGNETTKFAPFPPVVVENNNTAVSNP